WALYDCQESSCTNVALAPALSCRHRTRDSYILPYPFAKEFVGVGRRLDKSCAGASRRSAKKKQNSEKQESRPSLSQAVLRSILGFSRKPRIVLAPVLEDLSGIIPNEKGAGSLLNFKAGS